MFWLAFIACRCSLRVRAGLDGERLRALWVLPLQQVVYRQLMYLVTIQSVITALLGTRHAGRSAAPGVFTDGSPVMPTPEPDPHAMAGRQATLNGK